MPSLEMKTRPRPSMCSSREEHISLVCHRPSKISKCSHPQDRITEATIVLDASILQNASSCPEVPGESTELMESNDCVDSFARPSENSEQILETAPLSPDTARRMVADQSSSCPSIDETIFSPILEQDEAIANTIYDDAVSNLHVDLPHLVADDGDDSRCYSNAYPSCSVSDYSISELCVPAFSFDETMGFSGLINNMSPDYDHINSELTFDMEDRYMMLPFIEKTVELNATANECREVLINVDDPYLYVAIHQLKQSEQETEISFYSDDMAEPDNFDPHLFIKMPEMSDMTSSACPIMVPKEAEKRKPVTLVLDLDETLVHSTLDPSDGADFTFLVFFNMMEHTVYVRKRPHLHAFLERVAQMFEIVIFTASQSIYAGKLLDILDPDKKLISRRVYRESCVFSEGSYVKDLTVLGIDLAKVVIIDNCPQVFRLQVNNGIPIKSWFDDPSDKALVSLLPFLETLVDVDDVRTIIAKKFSNKLH